MEARVREDRVLGPVLLCLVIVLLVARRQSCSSEDRNVRVSRPVHCPNQMISPDHRFRSLPAPSPLGCAVQCQGDDRCLSLTFNSSNKMCYLGDAIATANCSNMITSDKDWRYLEKDHRCMNEGYFDSDGNCVCVNSFMGTKCERRMMDCIEGKDSGFYMVDGVYDVWPASAPAGFKVFCMMERQSVRTYVLNREDQLFSFNRSWAEYRDSFEDLEGDFWLGLENIHLLTQGKIYQLRFVVKPDANHYRFYSNFTLTDESSLYTFSISETLTQASLIDDCLGELQGAKFSTYDADNDDNPATNCASKHGGGWWFKGDNCSICNPMGPLLPPFSNTPSGTARQGVNGEMFWHGLAELYPFPVAAFLLIK